MYDYIIVGAGSAGCVLANRLSAQPDVSVLLLEAGGPDTRQELRVPLAFSKLFGSELDWNYHTEPEPESDNQRHYWPRGKTLGGSSALNAMIYIRGHRADYDAWSAACNKGWSFAELLPYFKKAQHQERGPSEYHGVGGPLNVADQRSPSPLSFAFVEAGAALGLARNPDFNGPSQDGVGLYQVNQKGGERHSAADAYLRPARQRPNLTILTHAHALRVCFEHGRAVAICFLHQGREQAARAQREVILSAGAINSPQLLMLSGIGPADSLRRHALPVVADLPGVGQNLQDHLAYGATYASRLPVSLAGAETMQNLATFVMLKRGPLTSNVGEGGAFVRTRAGLEAPDLQFIFAPCFFMRHGFDNPGGHGFTLGAILLQPQSRGCVMLRSADPLAAPLICPRYLAEPADTTVLLAGVRLARELAHTTALSRYRGDEVWPGAAAQSDAAIAAHLRGHCQTLYHPVGTCKMGGEADPLAVVDNHLRVRGVVGLRVVDASVMPTIVRGNTHAPTVMIAEKAAALIHADTA